SPHSGAHPGNNGLSAPPACSRRHPSPSGSRTPRSPPHLGLILAAHWPSSIRKDTPVALLSQLMNLQDSERHWLPWFGPAGKLRMGWACWLNQKDRKSTRLNSSHVKISYAVFCLKK